jgi:hypothetical protein
MIVCPAGNGKCHLPLGATDDSLKKSLNSLKLLSRSVDSGTALFVRADEAIEIVKRLSRSIVGGTHTAERVAMGSIIPQLPPSFLVHLPRALKYRGVVCRRGIQKTSLRAR